ncbi:MAG: preprotein translocase subunit SecA [Pseudomonadota bacterium]
MSLIAKLFGTRNDRLINREIRPLVDRINGLESGLISLSDIQIKERSMALRLRLQNGEPLKNALPEAYALCREASKRALGMRHFDVQLIGGIVLNSGKIAEMKTGEGKTLTATLPCYLHGLSGKGAHVITVNDYLAERDATQVGRLFDFLGLRTGIIHHGLSDQERKDAYAADITYGTNNEIGFDFLRDNMKTEPERLVQRGFNFGIVDEVDSILIDEARTPLIISGPSDTKTELYVVVNHAIPGLQKDSDYVFDEKSRAVSLTEDGISKLEKRLKVDNLYDPKNIDWLHHVNQALKAQIVFKKDVDYVVRGGEVVIVDEFTGRLMPGRRYSDGLHGALEAKENVQVQRETQTLATVTFQNLFRMYKTLAGMTGTADTEAAEFQKIYNLDVVVVPTNRVMIRKDEQDLVYRTAKEKYVAIADEIALAQAKGQPVLVGTVSVEKSELLSSLLTKKDIPHEVLNAKNHAREATIIEEAGLKNRVTIATNMAGRGTDIKLGEGVSDVGGLYVIGTERHDSRRIDNQLRGRSGRQGDPGRSKFFLSLEDDLMRIFASDRLGQVMKTLGMKDGEAIESPMVSRAIERAQKRVEEQNFSSRKHLLEYDDVMNQQRQVIYSRRSAALNGQSDLDFFGESVTRAASTIIQKYSPEATNSDSWQLDPAGKELSAEFGLEIDLEKITSETQHTVASLSESVLDFVSGDFERKLAGIEPAIAERICSYIYLQVIDHAWKNHLLAMDALKDSVSLRGYGQRDPLQEYKKEAFTLFQGLVQRIEDETTLTLLRMPKPTLSMARPPEMEESEMDFVHPDASPAKVTEKEPLEEDRMIYHGTRLDREAPQAQGTFRNTDKVGRNDPCPCGSGKKFKQCHGKLG